MANQEPVWIPAQHQPQDQCDLRSAKLGPKGYKENRKRKLEEAEQLCELQPMEVQATTIDADADSQAQSQKRQKVADGFPYRKVSGKTWKAPSKPANSAKNSIVGTSWEKKMAIKAAKQTYLIQKREAEDSQRAQRKKVADQRRKAKELKKANQEKSTVVQKISNSKTLKKMMKNKKQKKTLRTADTN